MVALIDDGSLAVHGLPTGGLARSVLLVTLIRLGSLCTHGYSQATWLAYSFPRWLSPSRLLYKSIVTEWIVIRKMGVNSTRSKRLAEQMQQYNVRLPRWLRDFIQSQPEPAVTVRNVLIAWRDEVILEQARIAREAQHGQV